LPVAAIQTRGVEVLLGNYEGRGPYVAAVCLYLKIGKKEGMWWRMTTLVDLALVGVYLVKHLDAV